MQGFICQANPINLSSILWKLLDQFASVIPNLLAALVVAIVGYILAKLVTKLIEKLLARIGVDKLAEKLQEIDFISKSEIEIKISKLIAKTIYYLIMIFAIMAATEVLGMPAVSELMVNIINYIPNLIVAVIVLIVGTLFANFIKGLVSTATASLGLPSGRFIASFVFYFLFISVVLSALGQAKVNTDFLKDNLTVIVGGAVLAFSIGYGFASREMMANFIASFYSKSKVQVGDEIRIGEVKGLVIEVDNSSFVVDTGDTRVIVPLSKLTSENVEIISEAPLAESNLLD